MIITTTTAVPTWQKSRYVLKRDDRDVERIAETNEPGTFHWRVDIQTTCVTNIIIIITTNGLWTWPWPWIGSYCIPSCITTCVTNHHTVNVELTSLWTFTGNDVISTSTQHDLDRNHQDGLWRPSSTACSDLDLWPPISNQAIS